MTRLVKTVLKHFFTTQQSKEINILVSHSLTVV